MLQEWHVVLQIKDEVLVDQVVHLVIHTFHDVYPDAVESAWFQLKNVLLNIGFKVPGQDFYVVCYIVSYDHLEHFLRLLDRFNNLENFIGVREHTMDVLENISIDFFEFQTH